MLPGITKKRAPGDTVVSLEIMRILILNGSLGGDDGNTKALLKRLIAALPDQPSVEQVILRANPPLDSLKPKLEAADAFVFATGTYWDSWGSPLQRFLEDATELEGGATWLGKPAAVVVTMHSVGGKAVLSRLQGVLSTLGCLIPPMSGMVYSYANQLALSAPLSELQEDLWRPEDLEVIAHNLVEAARGGKAWRPWSVDGGDAGRQWVTD